MDWKSNLRKTWNHRFLGSTLPLRTWRWRITQSSRSALKSQSSWLCSWRKTLSEDKKIRWRLETILRWDLYKNHWTDQERTSEHRVINHILNKLGQIMTFRLVIQYECYVAITLKKPLFSQTILNAFRFWDKTINFIIANIFVHKWLCFN